MPAALSTRAFRISPPIPDILKGSAAVVAAIVDTGPLVAFFDRSERHHGWVADQIGDIDAPLLVCEPVLAETMYLLARLPKAQDAVFALIERGALRIGFSLADHVAEVHILHRRYRDRPMSLADACIVRMAELNARHRVFTLDSDFLIYRERGGRPLSLIHPGAA